MRNCRNLLALAGCVLILFLGANSSRGRPGELPPVTKDYPQESHRVVLFEFYEMAASLGAWDRIVGISRYAYDNDLLQKVVPNLRQIPAPGSGFDVNMESLLTLKPDLVVTWSRKPETEEFIRRHGLPVFSMYPEGLANLHRDLIRLGIILGQEERAKSVSALMDRSLAKLQQKVAAIPEAHRPRVLFLWGKPTTIQGNKGVVPEIITLMGGHNLGKDLDAFNQEISMETIVAMNPEVVLIWGSASYGPDDLLHDPKWQTIAAVKNRRVFKATRASTWSPRLVRLAWWMARCFYPQFIADEEMTQALDGFYRSCFGIPYEETP